MKGYIIVEVQINDPVQYEEYKKITPGTLAKYHGKFVVRGGQTESLEGDWNPQRIVVLEFPSVELAKSWWNSIEYAPAKSLRQRTAYTRMILVQGAE